MFRCRRRAPAVALLSVAVVLAAVLVQEARGTRLRAVDSAAPWGVDGKGDDLDLKDGQHEDRGWSWKLPQAAMTVVKECLSSSSAPDTASCIRTMAARALDRVARAQREVNLGAGLVLVPDAREAAKETARSLDTPGGGGGGDEALGSRLLSLLQGYSLRLQLPSARTIREVIDTPVNASGAFTGRRRNGGIAPLLVFGSSLLPVKMSLLALLVGKALMLSTLAFAIPALRLLQGGGMGGGGGGGGGGGHHCH